MEKRKFQYDVTINNIEDMEPIDVFNYMHEKFDRVIVPEAITSAEDLTEISNIISWSANVKTYLNALSAFLDIITRNAKNAKQKEKHDQLVCKKNIIKGYYEHIGDVYAGASRLASIYFRQQDEFALEGRANNIQYGSWYKEHQRTRDEM